MGWPSFLRVRAFHDAERTTLLAAILGFGGLTAAGGVILPRIISQGQYFQDPAFWAAAVGVPVFAALFWAAWNYPVRSVAPVFVAAAFVDAWLFTVLIQGSGYLVGNYAYLTVIVLLAAFFLSARTTALYAGLNLVGVGIVHNIWGLSGTDLALSLTYIVLFSTLLVALAGLLRREQTRLLDVNRRLSSSLRHHELVQAATQDVIITLDAEHHITSMNTRAKEMTPAVLGKDLGEGTVLTAHLPPPMVAAFLRLQQAAQTSGVGTIEKSFETPNGRQSFRASLVPDGEGGSILFATDVTDQHIRMEQEMEKMFQQAEIKGLQDLQEMQKNFINMASHELQTPLTPLRLQARLLSMRGASYMTEEDQHAVEIIERNTERMALLVDDILEVVRIGNGRLPMEMRDVDLVKVCDNVVSGMLPAAADAAIELDLRTPTAATAYADPVRIEQVLVNLVSNAVKFSHEGGHVIIDLEDDPQEIHISVKDDGAGMEQDEIGGLFRPFTQFHQDVAPRTGTGLGLAICKGIMEAHGGTIVAHSDGRDHGSTFTVTLPRERAPHKAEPAKRPQDRTLDAGPALR